MTKAVLPDRERAHLIKLHKKQNRKELREYVTALRANKWTLAAIGEPLGVGRSTVRLWEIPVTEVNTLTGAVTPSLDLPKPPVPESRRPKPIKLRPDVPKAERAKLRELALSAQFVRGGTPQDSKYRADAAELDALIDEYLKRLVPVTTIAAYMGVTHRAVRARMERYHAGA